MLPASPQQTEMQIALSVSLCPQDRAPRIRTAAGEKAFSIKKKSDATAAHWVTVPPDSERAYGEEKPDSLSAQTSAAKHGNQSHRMGDTEQRSWQQM